MNVVLTLLWLCVGTVAVMVAYPRGPVSITWFFYCLVLWPVALPRMLLEIHRTRLSDPIVAPLDDGGMVCSECPDQIEAGRRVCGYCGSIFAPVTGPLESAVC